MLLQNFTDPFDIDFNLEIMLGPLFMIITLLFLMLIMVSLYMKVRIFLVILVVFVFSLVMGNISLSNGDIPFSPYLQIFFMVFQTFIFILTSIDAFGKK